MVMTVKGRGDEEGIRILRDLASEYPIYIKQDMNEAVKFVKELTDQEAIKAEQNASLVKPSTLKKRYNKNKISAFM